MADAYATTFAPLCAGTVDAVLDAACVGKPGARGIRVLDVGAGTGALAAAALAAGADVTAVDPDPDMVAMTAATAPGAQVQKAGLPDLPFGDGTFDAVLANFVVNHVPDPRASVRELVRVAAPGARVVVTIWPSGQNVQSRLWADVLESSGVVPSASVRLPADKDFARTRDGLAELLTDAGLQAVEVKPVAWEHRAAPRSLWRGAEAGIGGIGTIVASQSPSVQARMRAAYDRLVVPLLQDGSLVLATDAVLAVGTRAQPPPAHPAAGLSRQ